MDMISNLPDPLLSHILSLLPTQNAVATTVLSTRWKFLWTSVSNLDICSLEYDPQLYPTATLETKRELQLKSDEFTLFVNRVLRLLNPPSVQNFRLKCYHDCFDLSCLNSWLSAGFGRTFREFELSFTMRGCGVKFPPCDVYCNVVDLKLDGDIYFFIPVGYSVCFPRVQTLHLNKIAFEITRNASVSFPNLKNMHLSCVKFATNDSIPKLFSSCPVLDDLSIERRDDYDDVRCLIICIPSLTRLSIECLTHYNDSMSELQIDSPALQYLNLFGGSYSVYVPAGNLSSVLHANVKVTFFDDFDEDNVSVDGSIRVITFLRSLCNVKFLSVSRDVVKAFRTVPANSSLEFHNLTRLEMPFAYCLDLSVIVNKFLENMDNLEHLVIKNWGCGCSSQSWWTEPLNVPKCLLSRVTTFSFSYVMDDCCNQLELLKYFLKNAEVLQLLTICIAEISAEKRPELLKKISLIPRGSQTCQVAFT